MNRVDWPFRFESIYMFPLNPPEKHLSFEFKKFELRFHNKIWKLKS